MLFRSLGVARSGVLLRLFGFGRSLSIGCQRRGRRAVIKVGRRGEAGNPVELIDIPLRERVPLAGGCSRNRFSKSANNLLR